MNTPIKKSHSIDWDCPDDNCQGPTVMKTVMMQDQLLSGSNAAIIAWIDSLPARFNKKINALHAKKILKWDV